MEGHAPSWPQGKGEVGARPKDGRDGERPSRLGPSQYGRDGARPSMGKTGGGPRSLVAAGNGGPCSAMAVGRDAVVAGPKADATERVPPRENRWRATVPRGRDPKPPPRRRTRRSASLQTGTSRKGRGPAALSGLSRSGPAASSPRDPVSAPRRSCRGPGRPRSAGSCRRRKGKSIRRARASRTDRQSWRA